jgi:hypothetical protein
MFWDFYLPPIGECVVSRGCIRLEERGSIYLVDPVAIIEVRGEEVLSPTLDWSRLWRRVPWVTRWFRAVLRDLGFGDIVEIPCLYAAATAQENIANSLSLFLPLDDRPLKAAYSW